VVGGGRGSVPTRRENEEGKRDAVRVALNED